MNQDLRLHNLSSKMSATVKQQDPKLASLAMEFAANRFLVIDNFLGSDDCLTIMNGVKRIESSNGFIVVDNSSVIATQKFDTLNGDELTEAIPLIDHINLQLQTLLCAITSLCLVPLDNRQVGIGLNVTRFGGELSWHYDRNLITAVLYASDELSEGGGGELEVLPRYRLRLENNHRGLRRWLQKALDAILRFAVMRKSFGRLRVVRPKRGSLLVMDSSCLHAVRPLKTKNSRVAIVLCYDRPGKSFPKELTRDLLPKSWTFEN